VIRARPHLSTLDPYEPGTPVDQLIEAHGINDAVNLALNESPFEPPAQVVAAVAAAGRRANRYPEDGAPRLRAALGGHLGVAPDAVAVGCGSVDMFQQLCLALLDPGDSVVCGEVSFPEYWRTPRFLRAEARRVPMDGLALDVAAMARAVDETTRLVIVANPNNPTGTVVAPEALEALLDAVPEDVAILFDEAYADFCDPGRRPPSIEWLSRYDNLVVSRTFSKALGIGGVRLGYLVADPAFLAEVAKVHLPYDVSALAEAAGLAALSDEVLAIIEERVALVRAQRHRITEVLRGARWPLSDAQGNFTFSPTSRGLELAGWFLERGIVVRGISSIGLRITVGTPAENDRLCEAVAEFSAANDVAAYF